MSTHLRAIVAALAAVLITSACSSDDDAGEAPPPADGSNDTVAGDGGTADEDPVGSGAAGSGAAGTVEVDGVTYGLDEALRCEDHEIDGGAVTIESELELQGFSRADGEMIQIDINISQLAGMTVHDVSWNGPEGLFAVEEEAEINWSEGDDRVTGSATLIDAFGGDETIDITFDVAVPGDRFACR